MRFLPEIAIILSSLSVLSFLISEFGHSNVPILYPWGVWLHEYWFADYQERYKRKRGGPFAIDGPPLIVVPSDGGQMNWPYAAAGQTGVPYQYTDQYAEVTNSSSKYTPVDGIGGVSKSRIKDDPTSLKYYYPEAQAPGDYIANRFLGKGFSQGFASLENVGALGKSEVEYNKNVFQGGSPFVAASIGGGKPEDPRWSSRPIYQSNMLGHQLLVPLTSTAQGDSHRNPQVEQVADRNRDYSGAEYTADEKSSGVYHSTMPEAQSMGASSHRPAWYEQKLDGEYMGKQDTPSLVYAGDLPDINASLNQQYLQTFITNTFTNQAYSPYGTVGWGEPSTYNNPNTGLSPVGMQLNYISGQLDQNNPLPSVSS